MWPRRRCAITPRPRSPITAVPPGPVIVNIHAGTGIRAIAAMVETMAVEDVTGMTDMTDVADTTDAVIAKTGGAAALTHRPGPLPG